MQLVQTRMRRLAPSTLALTGCRFTFQRRRVVLWAWEILLPNCGPLPQSSHLAAMTIAPILYRRDFPGIWPEWMRTQTGVADVAGTHGSHRWPLAAYTAGLEERRV